MHSAGGRSRFERAALFGALAGLLAFAASARAQDTGARPAGSSAAKTDSTGTVRAHLRVVGVFDEESGDPLEGVDVTDFFTGITARTTKTGTMALILGDTTGTLVRLKKVGYQPITMPVGTALRDSTPLTVLMLRAGHRLPAVITIGERTIELGKGDTVSALLRNGFYERREIGGAPRAAFIAGDRMRGTSLLTNARFFGRPICESNLYIDGVKVTAPRRTGGHFLKEGVDGLVDPLDVAGIETYRSGELPVGTAHTMEGPGTFDPAAAAANAVANASGTMAGTGCVTFIWLRD